VRNRDVLERLQREIASVPDLGHVTREQIKTLPFLRCCLNESMSNAVILGNDVLSLI